jgi:hypothetical protein
VVGHSHYFRAMLGVDFKFSNCEVWRASFDPSEKDPKRRWTNLERLCGSSTAKPTFGAEGPDAWSSSNGHDAAALGSRDIDSSDNHNDPDAAGRASKQKNPVQ